MVDGLRSSCSGTFLGSPRLGTFGHRPLCSKRHAGERLPLGHSLGVRGVASDQWTVRTKLKPFLAHRLALASPSSASMMQCWASHRHTLGFGERAQIRRMELSAIRGWSAPLPWGWDCLLSPKYVRAAAAKVRVKAKAILRIAWLFGVTFCGDSCVRVGGFLCFRSVWLLACFSAVTCCSPG